MSDYEVCDHEEDEFEVPSWALSGYDLAGWVVTGAAHLFGAVANTLGPIGREFFAAGNYKRDQDRAKAELAKDRSIFDGIIAQPVLPEDPRG